MPVVRCELSRAPQTMPRELTAALMLAALLHFLHQVHLVAPGKRVARKAALPSERTCASPLNAEIS
jgi:hypothetical protein